MGRHGGHAKDRGQSLYFCFHNFIPFFICLFGAFLPFINQYEFRRGILQRWFPCNFLTISGAILLSRKKAEKRGQYFADWDWPQRRRGDDAVAFLE